MGLVIGIWPLGDLIGGKTYLPFIQILANPSDMEGNIIDGSIMRVHLY